MVKVTDQLSLLPHSCGVYRFLDKDGKVIYVGKAKDLKKRVSQYFSPGENLSVKTKRMVSRIHSLDCIVVETESDALLLENNLIKTWQPRYNILLKDDKTFPWICIKNEPFPRVFQTRKVVKDGSLYFGPYTSAYYWAIVATDPHVVSSAYMFAGTYSKGYCCRKVQKVFAGPYRAM